ncbi:GNAT family N-acetyltransferase [Sciscionella sediminilitoris]|uniref:GNAT family N-acetyltransferase n=1 Tax=Sciscionella sediminilitoris TaxID=1445613 RepID=UPI0018D06427|nr:GNAT family N-acetyltransferase [Sciscionella sp. SE31]
MCTVRRAVPADTADCVAIVRGLPEYFTEDVPDKIAAELREHPAWVAEEGTGLAGFAIVDRRSAHAAEIRWLAVAGPRRGNGVGTRLLDHLVRELAADGLLVLEVKTLDARAGYQPYVATRAFWERNGFVQVDTIDPFPDWPPGNPAAIYIAALGTTR